jgi:hypothetical protein
MNRVPLLLFLLLSGCASIDYQAGPVSGLGNMTVEEHIIDGTEIYQACSRCGQRGLELPTACTCINFTTNHAVIWLARDASQSVIEHERAHGRGYDHTDGELRSRYQAWVARGGTKIALPHEPTFPAGTTLTKAGDAGAGNAN